MIWIDGIWIDGNWQAWGLGGYIERAEGFTQIELWLGPLTITGRWRLR